MSSIDEKRVYSTTEGKTDVYVATGAGIACVECSDDHVGGFGLLQQCVATDIAAGGGQLAVATDEDVLSAPEDEAQDLQTTGFGPASAVGYHDTDMIAAGAGRIARYDGSDWHTLARRSDDVRVTAIDGTLLAQTDGVYRLTSDSDLAPVGLDDVRDVSTAGVPLAATARGVFQLGNGWMNVLSGDATLVASNGDTAHAVVDEELFVRTENSEWRPVELPPSFDGRIAGVAHGDLVYAVTVDGTFLVRASDGWRTQSLGLPDVCGVAVCEMERGR